MVITDGFAADGSGRTDGELARMRELFRLAGLDLAKYNTLQEQ
ncbi:MAG TPA: hypothetical protein VK900_07890 [Anaerolineales bacterium]|nr:hypothetical protein [Anaerolineales bacterium]